VSSHTDAVTRWKFCAPLPDDRLKSARLALHWAVQPIAAVGNGLLQARADYSHTALSHAAEHDALVGEALRDGRRFGLRLEALELIELVDGRVVASESLVGRTLTQAYDWVRVRLEKAQHATDGIVPPDYGADGIEPAPVSNGAVFDDGDREARGSLAVWFSNAAALLESFRAVESDASPVRCWPHHFDIATLLSFDPGEPDAEKARSCGLGLSPGDNSSKVPYFYVGPWPRPAPDRLPLLAGDGAWSTEGGVVARLDASKIFALSDPRAQATLALAFLESGLAASKELLGV